MKRIPAIALLWLAAFSVTPLAAQFGQNIVQYDRYDWQYIQTPQFDIYFYGDDRSLAEFVSSAVTESYRQISDRLNWQLQKRVSIMIYQSHADFQQTNVTFSYMSEGIGGVTELFKNRVVVPFEGSYADFRHVLHHELVHAILNDMVYGGNIQSIVSGRVRYAIPLWMNEGLAEYLAMGWESNSDMYMRDLALNGDIPPVNQLSGLYAYRGGQSVWRFITDKYGEESIAEIFTQIKSKANVDQGLKEAIGTDIELLSEQWKERLKKEYWPDVAGRDRLKDIAFRVTDHQKLGNIYNIAPSISPDGSKLAILTNRHANMEIILISATDGRKLKRLIKGGTTAAFEELHLLKPGIAWSPDGDKVAFAAKAASKDILYVVDIKSGDVEEYPTNLEGIFNATWNPDGGTIALVGNNGVKSDIYLLDIASREFTNLTDDLFAEFNPVWSPDGSKLAFGSDRGDQPAFRYDSDGVQYAMELRADPVMGTPLTSTPPDFVPAEFDFSGADIFTINRDGSNLVRLTTNDAQENFPVYAHSAPYLYFISNRSGINNVYMLNLDTGEERSVTNILTGISDLNMAVDDSRLYFTGFEESGFDIFSFHNPLEMWDQATDVKPSNYLLAEGTPGRTELVNQGRESKITRPDSDYSQYVFGVDDPEIFRSQIMTDTSLIASLDEASLLGADGRPKVHSYRTRFTLDLVQSYAGYSTLYNFQGMTQFMFSDMLGNHRISLATEMQISLKNSDYYLTYHFLPYRTNFYFTLFHTALIFQQSFFRLTRLRHFGIDLAATYPLDRFRRIDVGVTSTVAELSDFFDTNGDRNFDTVVETTLPTIIPRIGFVWDNAEWDFMYPVNGWRANLQLNVSPKVNSQSLDFTTLSFDMRRYFRLWAGTSLAGRVSGGISSGTDAQLFLVGGMPWIFSSKGTGRYRGSPFDLDDNVLKILYFSQYLTPLRGTQMMEMVGKKAVLVNLEFRFPFLIYYFPALRYIGQLGGVAFVDAGRVWDTVPVLGPPPQLEVIGTSLTYGWGPRFVIFGLPIQVDFARQYQADGPHPKSWYVTLGLDF